MRRVWVAHEWREKLGNCRVERQRREEGGIPQGVVMSPHLALGACLSNGVLLDRVRVSAYGAFCP
jgi:hypothetical protein